MKNLYNLPCNIAQTLNIIGDKWTLLILRQLMLGNDSYNKIKDNLNKIPSNLLSDRLKSLEENNLIETTLYQSHPPRYLYTLTQSGKDLEDIFNSLLLWGEKHIDSCNEHLSHTECEHKIDLVYYCEHCKKVVPKEELSVIDPPVQP